MFLVDGCEPEGFRGFQWEEVDLNDYARSVCPCSQYLDALAGMASRYCGGDYTNGARWSQEVDTGDCVIHKSSITNRLCQAAAVS